MDNRHLVVLALSECNLGFTESHRLINRSGDISAILESTDPIFLQCLKNDQKCLFQTYAHA
jgi:hypothetical protein